MGAFFKHLMGADNLAHTIQYGARPLSLGAVNSESQIHYLRRLCVERYRRAQPAPRNERKRWS
jgi:hypothetical protein